MIYRSAILIVFCGMLGCSQADNGRVPMNGSVSFEGKPVAYGSISLRPASGATGVASGGEIRDGVYTISKKSGPSEGSYDARFTLVEEGGASKQRLGKMKTISVPVEITSDQEIYDFELPPGKDK